jgi:hypothetical protein
MSFEVLVSCERLSTVCAKDHIEVEFMGVILVMIGLDMSVDTAMTG